MMDLKSKWVRLYFSSSWFCCYGCFLNWNVQYHDRAERHHFRPRLWLLFSSFLFPSKKEGRKKEEWIPKIVIKSHAFLLDQYYFHFMLIWSSNRQKFYFGSYYIIKWFKALNELTICCKHPLENLHIKLYLLCHREYCSQQVRTVSL